MGFTIGLALRFGWETFKKRPWFFVLATLILVLAELLLELVAGAVALTFASSEKELLIAFISTYFGLGIVVGTLAAMGWTAFFLAAHDNPETVTLRALWHPRPFWKFLGAGILFGLVVLAGFLVAILILFGGSLTLGLIASVVALVAMVIFGLMFAFSPMIVIDRERGPIEAMRESNRITRGHRLRLLGLLLVFGVISVLTRGFDTVLGAPSPINLLGALAVAAALFVLWPVATLALTHAYRVLSGGAATPQPADAALAA
jgi:hypothetical protein